MEITTKFIERAQARGACREAVRNLRAGQEIDLLPQSYLVWADENDLVNLDEITAVMSVPVFGTPILFALSRSGDGSGYGYGYGSGDGSGYGYG